MKGCCYRDQPLKPGLCLREHHLWMTTTDADRHRPRLRRCDAGWEEACPFRRWDHLLRLEVVRSRQQAIARCEACGGRHDTMLYHLRCQMGKDIDEALSSCPKWVDEGSTTQVFEPGLPSSLLATGRREVRSRVLQRDGFRCQECGRDLNRLPSWFAEVHHIVPRIRGGTDHPANLKTLCVVCHRAYTDELLLELSGEPGRDGRDDIGDKFGRGGALFARLLGDD
jgi:hypothetical protein